MKVYTLGVNGFVSGATIQALGVPRHVRQAGVLVVARTKAEAINTVAAAGMRAPSMSDKEFRLATGSTVQALDDAGLLDQAAVFATPLTGSGTADILVRIVSRDVVEVLGHLVRQDGKATLQPVR